MGKVRTEEMAQQETVRTWVQIPNSGTGWVAGGETGGMNAWTC